MIEMLGRLTDVIVDSGDDDVAVKISSWSVALAAAAGSARFGHSGASADYRRYAHEKIALLASHPAFVAASKPAPAVDGGEEMCKWCASPPAEGDSCCAQCRRSMAAMSSRHLSGDALWSALEQWARDVGAERERHSTHTVVEVDVHGVVRRLPGDAS